MVPQPFVSRPAPVLSSVLNHIRWISAFLVLLGHARTNFWLDYQELSSGSLVLTCAYFLSNLATQAVVCFFVLSGFLVGGKCLLEFQSGVFSPSRYAIDRLVRLYVVLIPALIVSGLLVFVGRNLIPLPECLYDPRSISSMIITNLFFLQNTATAPVCNNFPLWSLANEFWYYLLFPLILFAVYARQRTVSIILSTGIVVYLLKTAHPDRHDVLLYFPVWLIGTAASRWRVAISPLIPASALAVALFVSRNLGPMTLVQIASDYFIALSIGVLLSALNTDRSDLDSARAVGKAREWSSIVGAKLAAFSYSLYMIHAPILSLLHKLLLQGGEERKDPHTAVAWVWLVGTVALPILAAYAMYGAFESRTAHGKALCRRWLGRHGFST